jgi:hypothetical protein
MHHSVPKVQPSEQNPQTTCTYVHKKSCLPVWMEFAGNVCSALVVHKQRGKVDATFLAKHLENDMEELKEQFWGGGIHEQSRVCSALVPRNFLVEG